jgi:tripartite-type tricarboxylate transporter receptor subunit TctC
MKPIARFAAAACLALSSAAFAQSWPARPITLVIPFATGSGTDVVGRLVAQKLGERLRQPVVVENKAGASAQIAAQFVAAAKPDGYTLLMTTNTSHSANPSLFKSLKYDPIKDFTPITRVGELPFALVVNNDIPATSVQELIDHARANPGKLTYATPNSTSLVATETLKHMAGVDIVGVPYKSSPQAMQDTIAGVVQVYVTDLGSGGAMMKAGKVRTLAATPARGTKLLPGVPPVAQTLKGFDLTSWNGVFGPAGLPQPIVERVDAEIQAVIGDREIQEKLALLGFEVWPSRNPEEFAKYVSDQLALWTNLVRQAGIPPQ